MSSFWGAINFCFCPRHGPTVSERFFKKKTFCRVPFLAVTDQVKEEQSLKITVEHFPEPFLLSRHVAGDAVSFCSRMRPNNGTKKIMKVSMEKNGLKTVSYMHGF